MSKVYVPQIPHRFDEAAGGLMPTVDLSQAEKFGDLVVMLSPEDNRRPMNKKAEMIADKMIDFDGDDYYIGIGDPVLISIVAYIAGSQADGLLRILRWDRKSKDYVLVEVSP